ncbi:hypothetical protein LSTR_LSTR009037 [Laodelphax striatellus]|uniref:Uncharacterized protein n=1 Tax=Laodelphax striatellus TaxID=195883 RepID=A0A482XC21_LAOST|nr:hypothetical protein LSTR_LSTR009037 [Laodelphax striatellus]
MKLVRLRIHLLPELYFFLLIHEAISLSNGQIHNYYQGQSLFETHEMPANKDKNMNSIFWPFAYSMFKRRQVEERSGIIQKVKNILPGTKSKQSSAILDNTLQPPPIEIKAKNNNSESSLNPFKMFKSLFATSYNTSLNNTSSTLKKNTGQATELKSVSSNATNITSISPFQESSNKISSIMLDTQFLPFH